MGYPNVRHYRGGLQDWQESGGKLEAGASAHPVIVIKPAASMPAGATRATDAAATSRGSPASSPARGGSDLSTWLIDMVGRRTINELILWWLGMIGAFGVLYWVADAAAGKGLRAGLVAVGADWGGFIDAMYFSFVTALSIGYGDVVPVGPMRVLAILEGAAGLLIFGCVISKLVSRRQDELLEQTHRLAFEDRLDRVRTSLHLVLSEMQTIAEKCSEGEVPPERVRTRVESTATIFAGELRTIHDLLYRPQQIPDETVLESILANVATGLREMNDLMACADSLPRESAILRTTLKEIAALAGEICGECVPRAYAPELKDWMDKIQEQSRRMA